MNVNFYASFARLPASRFPSKITQGLAFDMPMLERFISCHQFPIPPRLVFKGEKSSLCPTENGSENFCLLSDANKRHLSPYLTLQSKVINLTMNPFSLTFHANFLRRFCRFLSAWLSVTDVNRQKFIIDKS